MSNVKSTIHLAQSGGRLPSEPLEKLVITRGSVWDPPVPKARCGQCHVTSFMPCRIMAMVFQWQLSDRLFERVLERGNLCCPCHANSVRTMTPILTVTVTVRVKVMPDPITPRLR